MRPEQALHLLIELPVTWWRYGTPTEPPADICNDMFGSWQTTNKPTTAVALAPGQPCRCPFSWRPADRKPPPPPEFRRSGCQRRACLAAATRGFSHAYSPGVSRGYGRKGVFTNLINDDCAELLRNIGHVPFRSRATNLTKRRNYQQSTKADPEVSFWRPRSFFFIGLHGSTHSYCFGPLV